MTACAHRRRQTSTHTSLQVTTARPTTSYLHRRHACLRSWTRFSSPVSEWVLIAHKLHGRLRILLQVHCTRVPRVNESTKQKLRTITSSSSSWIARECSCMAWAWYSLLSFLFFKSRHLVSGTSPSCDFDIASSAASIASEILNEIP